MSDAPLLLLVEDEVFIALPIEETLQQAGFEVIVTTNGKQAMATLEARAAEFQALVTDIRLPGAFTGWQIARRARELNSAIAVVYASGDSAADWSAEGVPNSVMLQKPFANAQLVTAVTTLLNQLAASPPPAP